MEPKVTTEKLRMSPNYKIKKIPLPILSQVPSIDLKKQQKLMMSAQGVIS